MNRRPSLGAAAGALLLLVSCLRTGLAATGPDLESRLRSAVRLPTVMLGYHFGGSRTSGWLMEDDPGDSSIAIAELEAGTATGAAAATARLQVARLTARSPDASARRDAIDKARTAWTQLLADSPGDPVLLAGLGATQDLAGEWEAAEGNLRRALEAGPESFSPWQAWTGFLTGRAYRDLFSGTNQTESLRRFQSGGPIPADALAAARKSAAEALVAADRAVALQPESPLPYASRAQVRTLLAFVQAAAAQGESAEVQRLRARAALPLEAVPDLEAASARRPEDYRLHAAVIWHRFTAHLFDIPEPQGGGAEEPPVNQLSAEERRALDERMARLQRVSESPRKWLAAGALETMAMCRHILFGDPQTGGELAQRALALDPGREQAGDLALSLVVVRKDWPALADLCRRILETRPEARLWLIRAKAEYEQGQFETVAASLARGLALDPGSASLLAARFALWLRTGDLPARAVELRPEIEATFAALRSTSDTDEGTGLYHSFFPTSLIAAALDGDLEESRSRARRWVAANPEDEYARDVLEILQSARP